MVRFQGGLLPEGQDIAVSAHVPANTVAHFHSEGFAAKKNFRCPKCSRTEEDELLCMHPHKIMINILFEKPPLASVPRKVDKIPFLSRVLLDVTSFALTEASRVSIPPRAGQGQTYISAPQFHASLRYVTRVLDLLPSLTPVLSIPVRALACICYEPDIRVF